MGMTNIETKPIKQSFTGSGVPFSSQAEVFRWQVIIHPQTWQPPTDVYETEDRLIIRVEIAGMKESDFTVRLERNHLYISGVRLDTPEPRAYHRMEINFGEFSTEVELFTAIDASKIDASYKDGFLIILLPKSQPKQISINT